MSSVRAAVVLAAALVLTAVSLAACTSERTGRWSVGVAQPRNEAANADVGSLHVRNVFLLVPAAPTLPAQAPLFGAIVNGSSRPDRLVALSVPGGSVSLPSGGIALPPATLVKLPGGITVNGLRPDARGAVPVTMRFQNGGTVIVQVPVKPNTGIYATFSATPAPAASPSASPPSSPSASASFSPSASGTITR